MQATPFDEQLAKACADLGGDPRRAAHVVGLAAAIFGPTAHVHGLTKTTRPWLAAAAQAMELAGGAGPTVERMLGRLRTPELPAAGRRIVAAAVRLARAGQGRAGGAPPKQIAARMAALLAVADGLDRSRTGATRVRGISDDGRRVTLFVRGADALRADLAAARRAARAWNALLLRPIRFAEAGKGAAIDCALLHPDDTVVAAAQRLGLRQMERVLSREHGLAWGRDVEFVHEMRVATRRLRTLLRPGVLGRSFGSRCRPLREELRHLGDALGKVRDCDVFLLFCRRCRREATARDRRALSALVRAQRRVRRRHFRRMLEVFASPRYRAFRDEFHRLLTRPAGLAGGPSTPWPGAKRPIRLHARDILEGWLDRVQEYGRSLDGLDAEQLHRLRIACKRLRYTSEFFAEIYPKRLKQITQTMIAMQDLLGEVHDADVWAERIRRHATRGGAGALLARLAAKQTQCLREAQQAWRSFTRPKSLQAARKLLGRPR